MLVSPPAALPKPGCPAGTLAGAGARLATGRSGCSCIPFRNRVGGVALPRGAHLGTGSSAACPLPAAVSWAAPRGWVFGGVGLLWGLDLPRRSWWLLPVCCPTMCLAPARLPLLQPPPLPPPLLSRKIEGLQHWGCFWPFYLGQKPRLATKEELKCWFKKRWWESSSTKGVRGLWGVCPLLPARPKGTDAASSSAGTAQGDAALVSLGWIVINQWE